MTLKAFKQLQTGYELSQVQANIGAVLNPLVGTKILDGILIENISLDASFANGNQINHKLGRKYFGYIVVRKNAASDIWDDIVINTIPDKILILKCSVNTTISLWVF